MIGGVDWVRAFYSTTGAWWGAAEARIGDGDHRRVGLIHEHAGPGPHRVLELGSGYGNTAAATAAAGHTVTAVELSDRADFADRFAGQTAPGMLTVVKGDFFDFTTEAPFDVVTYWNGFGVGADADQRRLLTRIAAEWLAPGGVALVDVFNPYVWASWDGDVEHFTPDPAAGYHHELHQRTGFDPITSTAVDTWWEEGHEDAAITQLMRCYSPADLALLLAGTGLALQRITVGTETLPLAPAAGLRSLLAEHHEYLAVLRPTERP